MPIKIDFLANVRDFLRGTKDVDSSLDDVADSLDDVAKDGDRSTERLERSFKELADSARDTARDADRSLGTIGEDGFRRSSEAAGEFKQEALSNFSEVTSSFDGSMSSIQDLAQGTLGGLASSGLPGIGIAAGIAAAGVGLIGSAFQAAEDDRLKLEERANDLADAYIEAGSTVLDALTVADRTASILTNPEYRKEAEDLAQALGGDLALAVRILAGDTDALAEANTLAAAGQEYLDGLTPQQLNNTGKRKTAIGEEVEQLGLLIDAVDRQNGIQAAAAETAQTQSDILIGLANAAEGATVEVDELGNQLITLPDGKQVLINADTGLATTNIDTFKGDLDGIVEPRVTPIKVRDETKTDMDNIINRLSNKTVYINTRAREGGRDF